MMDIHRKKCFLCRTVGLWIEFWVGSWLASSWLPFGLRFGFGVKMTMVIDKRYFAIILGMTRGFKWPIEAG